MKDKPENEISQKLDIIIKLLAVNAIGHKSLREQIRFLYDIGLRPKDIASVLGKTANYVNVELVYIRKTQKR